MTQEHQSEIEDGGGYAGAGTRTHEMHCHGAYCSISNTRSDGLSKSLLLVCGRRRGMKLTGNCHSTQHLQETAGEKNAASTHFDLKTSTIHRPLEPRLLAQRFGFSRSSENSDCFRLLLRANFLNDGWWFVRIRKKYIRIWNVVTRSKKQGSLGGKGFLSLFKRDRKLSVYPIAVGEHEIDHHSMGTSLN